MQRRVVVTGLGAVSPLGLTVRENWQHILAGKSGISRIERFNADDLLCQIAGTVNNFDITRYITEKEARKLDVFVHYAIAATDEALADSGLLVSEANQHRIGVAIGSGIGGLPFIADNTETLLEKGARRISPFFIPGCIINMASGYISIRHHLQGPNIAIVTACTSGSHNIGYAARTIAYGDADVMIAGGAEMATSPLGIAGFAAMRALSSRNDAPELASRPWDKDRDGFVLSEGAGILILEEYEHAKKRGAHIYAELAGFGMSADASHMTMNDQSGLLPSRCMDNAVRDAKLPKEAIDYINAHATSTPIGDPAEVRAIKQSFGDHAYRLAVSSTKSMTGHLLGAAGAIEAVYTVKALADQVIPPTINLIHPDEECDLDFVPGNARQAKLKAALSNSFGFGGSNASLVFTVL